jgi:hypothetical protein
MYGAGRDLILEYLPGDEYTVDCFSDRERGLLFCAGRQRIRTKAGISMDSRPVEDEAFLHFARLISTRLHFHGAWFFQVKKDKMGAYKLLEIAPRVAGTMALHRVLGVNFPLLSLYEQERIPVDILVNPVQVEIDRALTNRYRHNIEYHSVYLDLDDTLILDGKVNPIVVQFVFQCINAGIQVILLTKHAQELDATLRNHRLAGIFDQVIHVDRSEQKTNYITSPDAILIDDSFSERKAAHDKLGILTFDCSMLELLLDERGR